MGLFTTLIDILWEANRGAEFLCNCAARRHQAPGLPLYTRTFKLGAAFWLGALRAGTGSTSLLPNCARGLQHGLKNRRRFPIRTRSGQFIWAGECARGEFSHAAPTFRQTGESFSLGSRASSPFVSEKGPHSDWRHRGSQRTPWPGDSHPAPSRDQGTQQRGSANRTLAATAH